MVFKRRDKLPFWQWIGEGIIPRGGWSRAISYIGHRLRRLPDSPHKIALGIAIGVYVCFTPFFGLHVTLAIILALILRANFLAAFLGTFFGNPATFLVIATVNFKIGNWVLGTGIGDDDQQAQSVLRVFGRAFLDLWHNLKAAFTSAHVDWTGFIDFFHAVMIPYLVGGLVPGIFTAAVFYFLTRPLIATYQKRRKGRLLQRWKERRKKSDKGLDSRHN